MEARDITAAYVDGLAEAIRQAREKTTETGQATDGSEAATSNAGGAERVLVTALQGVQMAAKQKHRMLSEDDNPATNFSTDGYFIGTRLNPNRATLLQNAVALIAKAKVDSLPGYKTPESINAIETLLTSYTTATADQAGSEEERGTERQQRDALIRKINTRRLAIQHAADALYPFSSEDRRPQRKSFQLPLSRPLAG